MSESSAYRGLKNSFEQFEGSIKTEQTDEGYSLESIEKDITEEIAQWGTSFRLTVNPIGLDDLVKNLIGHEIQDGALGQAQPTSSYGQGFQRSLIFTLIRVAAKYSTPKPKSKKKDFSPILTWLLFEEPEAFLHPSQIDTLNADLRKLAADDCAQVLLTTHNPQFVSKKIEDLPGLARMRRVDGKTHVGQISPVDLTAILAQNQAEILAWQAAGIPVKADDLTVDMESVKYILWLDPRRCGAFFAERVLLVEGPTEVALINYMLDQGILARPKGSFFVLDTVGKYNMHRFMNLLGKLGINHSVLHDSDKGKLQVVDQTIQNSKNIFTIAIDTFTDDLEAYLGIHETDKHRKPQHVMYQVVQGTIAASKMQNLVTKIAKLLAM
jgi:predicted ATP-dependent endonuclease of OLD family